MESSPIVVVAAFLVGAAGAGIAIFLWAARVQRALSESLRQAEPARVAAVTERDLAVARTREIEAELRASGDRLEQERRARTVAENHLSVAQAELEAERRNLEVLRTQFEQQKAGLIDIFRSHGSEVMKGLQQQMLEAASAQFAAQRRSADEDLAARQKAIDEKLAPVAQALERQQQLLNDLEAKRNGAYEGIRAQIEGLQALTHRVGSEAGRLATALRSGSQVRGKWGEIELKNLLELAGLNEHTSFSQQVSVTDADGNTLRPDCIVTLPGGGSVVIDAKVPLEHFVAAFEENADRETLLARHADSLIGHVNVLASKRYWLQFEPAPGFVVLFVPIEAAVSEAMRMRPSLQQDALASRVIVASPNTLFALLHAVAASWRRQKLAESAREISETGTELYARLAKFAESVEKVGGALKTATARYNDAIGSLEARVLPGMRKLKQLGAAAETDSDPVAPEQIDLEPRSITRPELLGGSGG
jgi:DNA recombination protein RmuC